MIQLLIHWKDTLRVPSNFTNNKLAVQSVLHLYDWGIWTYAATPRYSTHDFAPGQSGRGRSMSCDKSKQLCFPQFDYCYVTTTSVLIASGHIGSRRWSWVYLAPRIHNEVKRAGELKGLVGSWMLYCCSHLQSFGLVFPTVHQLSVVTHRDEDTEIDSRLKLHPLLYVGGVVFSDRVRRRAVIFMWMCCWGVKTPIELASFVDIDAL